MPVKADILADLRASVAAIERGDADAAATGAQEPSPPRGRFRGADGGARRPAYDGPEDGAADDGAKAPDGQGGTAEEAYRKVLRWAAVRERSSAYVRERLVRDGFPPEAVEEALARAVRVRAVDDRRYGDALVRATLAAGKGLRAAEAEIEALGIDPATLDSWQEHAACGREAEVARALEVLRRKPPRAKAAREAAFRRLYGRGFSSDVASTAARLWSEEAGSDAPSSCGLCVL